jgi:hypothetical protein
MTVRPGMSPTAMCSSMAILTMYGARMLMTVAKVVRASAQRSWPRYGRVYPKARVASPLSQTTPSTSGTSSRPPPPRQVPGRAITIGPRPRLG